ncbi:DUF3052 domain-containing protein [Undibacterium sp. TS12]|uniref:DUF3052 domain-containing protein n=1 Tax=Undibacterium sp. TS12 TaxID=2908202 RepID=UPI001F4D34CB|nr:DUF3052 domain-containing protein [Undibacterium sp. TS12]MCH8621882.1 DUF3052 domain-containing protein [Undibacterium sp. TS12]
MSSVTNAYSGTPLAKKLGIQAGNHVLVRNAPPDYPELLAPLPEQVHFEKKASSMTDLVHLFTNQKAVLIKELAVYKPCLRSDAIIWVSWPKKASKLPTDITEDVIREVILPLGYVDIKVCAVNNIWSGLKIVVRKELRATWENASA